MGCRLRVGIWALSLVACRAILVRNQTFVSLLHVKSTGSRMFSSALDIASHGCGCDQEICNCDAKSGKRNKCPEARCLDVCVYNGCFKFWDKAPWADWLELQATFVRSNIERSRIIMLTLLRDPATRVRHELLKTEKLAKLACDAGKTYSSDFPVSCDDYSVAALAKSPEVQERVFNRQTKMLAGLGPFTAEELYETGEQMLEVAKRHLGEMPWFGIFEQLEESTLLLQQQAGKFGMSTIADLDVMAKNKAKADEVPRLDEETAKLIDEGNGLDKELYEWAKRLLLRRVGREEKGSRPRVLATNVGSHVGEPIAMCVSGLCSRTPRDSYEAYRDWRTEDASGELVTAANLNEASFGELITDRSFREARPECEFESSPEKLGTYSWYISKWPCVNHAAWMHSNIYKLGGASPLFFSTRGAYPFKALNEGNYIVAIGDSGTMGPYVRESYLTYVEHLLEMPQVAISFGRLGAGFYVDLLQQRQDTPLGRVARSLVEGARMVIVQTMRLEGKDSSECHARCNSIVCEDGTLFRTKLGSLEADARADALKKSQDRWVAHHSTLTSLAKTLRNEDVSRTVVFLDLPTADSASSLVTDEMVATVRKTLGKAASGVDLDTLYVRPRIQGEDPSRKQRIHSNDRMGCLPSSERPSGSDSCDAKDGEGEAPVESSVSYESCSSGYLVHEISPRLHWLAGVQIAESFELSLPTASRLIPSKEVEVDPAPPHSFFSLLTETAEIDRLQPLTMIDTACRHHPGATFYLFTERSSGFIVDPRVADAIGKVNCTVEQITFDVETFFRGTPLEVIASGRDMKSSESLVQAAFRAVTFWRFGGWYLPGNSVIVQPLPRRTMIAWRDEKQQSLSGKVLYFSRKHFFLKLLMGEIRKSEGSDSFASKMQKILQLWPKFLCGEGPSCMDVVKPTTFTNTVGKLDAFASLGRDTVDKVFSKGKDKPHVVLLDLSPGTVPPDMKDRTLFYRGYLTNCVLCSYEFSMSVGTRRLVGRPHEGFNVPRDSWVALLSIPGSGADKLADAVDIVSHGCPCDDRMCRCASAEPSWFDLPPCTETECIAECRKRGCQALWKDAAFEDWMVLQGAFLHARIPRRMISLFTVLQNPAERALAEYAWILEHARTTCTSPADKYGGRFAWGMILPCDLRFVDYARSEAFRRRSSDRQTKMLAGLGGFQWEDLYESRKEMLNIAKRHLDEMHWFGLAGRMKESVWLLQKRAEKLGIAVNVDEAKLNEAAATAAEEIDTKTTNAILAANELDVALMEYATEVFNRRLEEAKSRRPHHNVQTRRLAKPTGHTVGTCVSGTCSESPPESYGVRKATLAKSIGEQNLAEINFGEMWTDPLFEANRPECSLGAAAGQTIGTISYYNGLSGCAYGYDWYRTNVYEVRGSRPYFFSTRAMYPHKSLVAGDYFVAIGDDVTLGVLSKEPYTTHLEHLLEMPSVTMAYGNVGAGFFVDLLDNQASTAFGAAAREIIAGARLVVVQTMKVETCEAGCNTLGCRTAHESPTSSTPPDELATRQARWRSDHQRLLSLASEIRQQDTEREVLLLDVLGRDPFVTDDMRQAVASKLPKNGLYIPVLRGPARSRLDRRDVPLSFWACISPPNVCSKRGVSTCGIEDVHDNCDCGSVQIDPFLSSREHWRIAWKVVQALEKQLGDGSVVELSAPRREVVPEGPRTRTNFMMLLSSGTASLTQRIPAVSIETACKSDPGSTFYMYVLVNSTAVIEPTFVDAIAAHGCPIIRQDYDPATFYRGTPLEGFVNARLATISLGDFWYSHCTDLFRGAALWRYGGFYLDADVLVLKSLAKFRNSVAWQHKIGGVVNNAISTFERQHPILESLMAHIARNYDPENWGVAGPKAITFVLRTWPRLNRAEVDPDSVTVFPYYVFFPAGVLDPLFKQLSDSQAKSLLEGASCIHLWNRETKDLIAEEGSAFLRSYCSHCSACSLEDCGSKKKKRDLVLEMI